MKDEELQLKIASIYGYRDLSTFINHIKSIVNIRNICSHNGILFDYNQPMGIRKIPNKAYKLTTRNQTNLNASISVIFNILSSISKNKTTELNENLDKLIGEALAIPELNEIIQQKIGYDIK